MKSSITDRDQHDIYAHGRATVCPPVCTALRVCGPSRTNVVGERPPRSIIFCASVRPAGSHPSAALMLSSGCCNRGRPWSPRARPDTTFRLHIRIRPRPRPVPSPFGLASLSGLLGARPPPASVDGVHDAVRKQSPGQKVTPVRSRKPRRQWRSRRWPVAGRRLLGLLVSTACAAALAGRAREKTVRPTSTVHGRAGVE
jgi:hypothetical protein